MVNLTHCFMQTIKLQVLVGIDLVQQESILLHNAGVSVHNLIYSTENPA